MALIECYFKSLVLDTSTAISVILPDGEPVDRGWNPKQGRRYRTLYLLHGIGDDHTKWARRTSVERYAKEYHLAVVMPQVDKSFYTDMTYGNRYWTFVSEELPALARAYFPLSDKREDNFVAGLSMGGYGSFKLAFLKPQNFCGAASFSGALDVVSLFNRKQADPSLNFQEIAYPVFGGPEKIEGTDNDLFALAKKQKAAGVVLPKLYQCCGTEDGLYQANLKFRDFAESIGLDLTFEDGPGAHTWDYWDESIRRALKWLPLPAGPADDA